MSIFTCKNVVLSYICNLNVIVNFQGQFLSFLNIILLSPFVSVFNLCCRYIWNE